MLPIFVFDSRERWFPVGVEESLDAVKCHVPTKFPVAARYVTLAGNDLDFPPNMTQPDLPPVVYHRRVRGGPLVWDQYWLWYLYNPKAYAGVGCHEGDWEFVQVGFAVATKYEEPVLMTCSQHHSGGKAEYWTVEERNGRPVVYVALGSHANYFHPVRTVTDECDGYGKVLTDYEVREFGAWKDWRGRWGNSRGEGKSPESPGRQGRRWTAPHLYHSSAR